MAGAADIGTGGGTGTGAPVLRWQLGRLALGLLAVTVASGIALAPFWSPAAPRASTEALAGGLPWGWWLRGIHAHAALGFLLATLGHLLEALFRGAWTRVTPAAWWRAVLLVPLAFGAMVGGFAMRGDGPAVAALAVWRGVLETVPLAGGPLATMVLGPEGGDLGTVALHHAGTFTLLAWLLSVEHGRRTWPDAPALALSALAAGAVAGLFPPGLDGPATAPTGTLTGPWYLWGLQGLLIDLPAWTAWALPLAGLLLLGAQAHLGSRGRRWTGAALLALAAAWMAASVRLLLAGGAG
jgi:hypothetical protein